MAKDTKDVKDTVEIASTLCARSIATLEEAKKVVRERSAEGALARGKIFSIAMEYAEAAACFSEALAMDSNLLEAAARLPLSLLKAGHSEKALTHAMALAGRRRDYIVQELVSEEKISAMTILGEALLANNRIEEAKDAYTAACQISPQDSYAAGRLAQLHLATGTPKEALSLARQFVGNPRACFRNLSAVLPLGDVNVSLLPRITAQSLVANVTVCMPGRPILSEGRAQVAPLVWGRSDWCAEISEESAP